MVENKDMEEFKEEWKKVKLGEVVAIRRGSSPRPIKDYVVEKGMPWVKIADATESKSKYINSTKEFIKLEGVPKSVIVEKGDLIFSNSGTAGIPWFMGITACIHDGWQVFREFNGINKDFLYFTLINIRYKLLHNANDSTMKNLTLDMVRDFEIELPPLETQEKIASILSALDDKIELNNEMNKTLEEMAQTLFKRWFIDFEFPNENGEPYKSSGGKMVESELGEIPEGWEVKTIGDVMEFSYGKALKKENRVIGEFPVIGSSGIVDYHNEFLVKGPGIVIGRKGTIGETIWLNDNFYPIDTTFYIESKINLNDILYYFYFILQNQDFKKISSDSAVPGLNRNLAYMNKVIISPNESIEKFINTIKGQFDKIEINKKEIQSLTQIRETLLPKLMNGEVEI